MRLTRFSVFVLMGMAISGCVASVQPSDQALQPNAATNTVSTELDANIPVWTVGDNWQYSDGYGLEVSEVAPNGVATLQRTDKSGIWLKRKGVLTLESQSDTTHRKTVYNSQNPEELYPLQVGRVLTYSREYMSEHELKRHTSRWSVVGKESIEVPAGKFDCWVLLWETQSQDSNWHGREKIWYSPEVRQYVRMEFKYGQIPASSRVLMSYKLAK